jgi:transposase
MSTLSIAPYFAFARIKVVRQAVHVEAHCAMVHMEPDQRFRPVCHACGTTAATVHSQGYRRTLRDLDMGDTRVWLQVGYRKVWCDRCRGARVEHLVFCQAGQRVTLRLARYVYELCKTLPVEEVARHLDLDPKTVRAIDQEFLEEAFGRTDYAGLRILAIDEVAVHRGQAYMTVVLDHESGRVVWMGEGRGEATLDAFFAGMTDSQKHNIEAVALDLWDPYIKAVRRHCPHARIVFDLFHLVKAYGDVVKAVRHQEYLNAREGDRRVFRGTHYLLLKNGDALTPDQHARLNQLLAVNATLTRVYLLKDQLKAVYRERFRYRVKWALDDWIAMAQTVPHPMMRAFIRRLRAAEDGILNHGRYPIGTSPLEGVNTKIKLLLRRAYGYHDSRYLALKVKQAFPGRP